MADLDSAGRASDQGLEHNENIRPVDHRSFRAQLEFSIGFAIARSRDLLRRILREHAPDDTNQELAARVVKHLERSGFDLDEEAQALRKRPPLPPHGMPRGE